MFIQQGVSISAMSMGGLCNDQKEDFAIYKQLAFSNNIIYSEHSSYIQYCSVRKYAIFNSFFLFPLFLPLSFSLLSVLGYLCSFFFLSFLRAILRLLTAEVSLISFHSREKKRVNAEIQVSLWGFDSTCWWQ